MRMCILHCLLVLLSLVSSNMLPIRPQSLKQQYSRSAILPIQVGISTAALLGTTKQAHALSKSSFFAERIREKDSLTYEPGLTEPDVYYPKSFLGEWTSNSTCIQISAPLGVAAFGGQRVYETALKDVNQSLIYKTRFVKSASDPDLVIADRLFNVESIAKVSIGTDSVIQQRSQPDSNLARRLHLVLSPTATNGDIYDVDLYPTDRAYRTDPSTADFEAYERTAQLISTRMEQLSANPPRPFRKDIETISIYKVLDENTLQATQRTATFLTKADVRYNKIFEINPRVVDHAIDVRLYHILYRRV